MKTLNIAIVGCGRVAGHHVRAIDGHPNLSLVAICDLKPDRMAALPGAERSPRYTNYHQMFREHPEIDVVAVVTPSGMHFEHALDAVQRYGKSVVIEKPVVMRPSQGDELRRAARAAGTHVFPVHQYRFNRCVQRILRAVRDGELGDIALATVRQRWCRPQSYYDRDPWRGTFALDGGCCTNQGIHHLDMLRYLAGEVVRVNASMRTFNVKIEVEDTVTATLEFASGALGVLEITTAARPRDYESSISIVGTRGTAMLGGWATDKLVTFSPRPEDEQAFSDSFADAYGFGHNDIYRGVYDTVTGQGRPAVEFDDAMQTMYLLHAVYLSAERSAWVNVGDREESVRLGRPDETLAAIYRTAAPQSQTHAGTANIEYSTPAIEEFYRHHRTRWDQFYESERVVFETLGFSPASSVLDLGCGCGGLGLALRERFGVVNYTGVEINRQAAATARLLSPTARFVCADILKASPQEVPEEGFDVVVSLGCIDWNVRFADMLAKAYRHVKPGGCFVSSFRLTPGHSLLDLASSYQYINFEGRKEGEVAPYFVLNGAELLTQLRALHPVRISGFGYWGAPSPTAVTPLSKVGFAVIAVHKGVAPAGDAIIALDLPAELIGGSSAG